MSVVAFLNTSMNISDSPKVIMARYIPSIRSEMNPTIVPIRMATTNPSNKANTNGNPAFANANEMR